MGKLINDSNLDYLKQQTKLQYQLNTENKYSKFMENAPVFVNYYRQNTILTTTDTGMGNVDRNIGDYSSKKYNKIFDIPIYGIDKSAFNLDDGELGITGSYETEGFIIPDTIEPIPEDYFSLDYQDHTLLFKVKTVQLDNIKSNNYYKIEFKYDRDDVDDIELQVAETFSCLWNNIGSDDKSVIKDDDLLVLREFNKIYDEISSAYLSVFYNDMCNTMTLEENDKKYYDPYLIEFIIQNKLFTNNESITSYVFNHILELPRDFIKKYKLSLYYNIQDKKEFVSRYRPLRIQDMMTYFYRSGDMYYTLDLKAEQGFEELYSYDTSCGFTYDYTGDDIIFNIILKYINNDTTLNDYIINNTKNFYCEQNKMYFVYVPIVLFILKNIMNNITINNIM